MRAKKPIIGDIYEVKVPSGLAYMQYTHEGEDNGELVRVLPGIYARRPDDFASFSQQKELYFTFCTLAIGLRKREVEQVSNQPVPESARPFPTMRKAGGRSREGRILNWHIGHGLRLYTIQEMQNALFTRELTPEQRKLSIAQICPISALAEDIERGWTPERNEELEEMDRQQQKAARSQTASLEPKTQSIDHFLYFPKKSDAEKAAQQLRNKEWIVEVKLGADGENWLVLGKQPAPIAEDIEDLRDELERLAKKHHGEYDGWGAAV